MSGIRRGAGAESTPGRRSAAGRRGLHPTAIIAAALVLLTLGALLLVRPDDAADRSQAAAEVPLRSAALTCPSALPGAETAYLSTGVDPGDSEVSVFVDQERDRLDVAHHEITAVGDTAGPVVLTAQGDVAPGLLGARFGDGQMAAGECGVPQPQTWFTGVGAGATHASVLELVNPDGGSAVADITLYDARGPIDVPDLRGVTVPGRTGQQLDLAEIVPQRGELTAHVVVARGRLGVSVLDRIPAIGAQPLTEDFLGGQAEPMTEALLLGLPTGDGRHDLVVTNPGENEARVEVRVVTADSSFLPEGLEELRVPPGATKSVSLSTVLSQAISDGALGLSVTSSEPVTATSRSVVGGDISHAVPVVPSDKAMTVLVPQGQAAVVLGDASAVGVATVDAWDADGKQLEQQKVELQPGQGGVVELPDGAAIVQVTPSRTSLHAVARVTGPGGTTVLPFRSRVSSALDPAVRPGIP